MQLVKILIGGKFEGKTVVDQGDIITAHAHQLQSIKSCVYFCACGTMRNLFVISYVLVFIHSTTTLWWSLLSVVRVCVVSFNISFWSSVEICLRVWEMKKKERFFFYQNLSILLGRCFSQKSHFTTEETLEPSTTGIKMSKANGNNNDSTATTTTTTQPTSHQHHHRFCTAQAPSYRHRHRQKPKSHYIAAHEVRSRRNVNAYDKTRWNMWF